jgi:hypothetical protein
MADALRACVAGGVLGLSVVAGAGPTAASTHYFRAESTATAVHVTVTQVPASSIITASLLDDAVAYAASTFDSGGGSEALSAPAFPGRLVTQGPQLLCTEIFTCPVTPPDYPLLADASYPRRQRDTATVAGTPTGAGPFVVTPLPTVARASATANTGSTDAADVSVLAGTAGAVTVRTSHTSTRVTSTAAMVHVHVETALADVTVGGVVHIAHVRSVDDIVVRAGRPVSDHPSVTVTGVTVAGHRAAIDDRGVHVDGTDGPSLSERLAGNGVSIRTLGVSRHDDRSAGRSDAVALQVDVALPVHGVRYIPNPLPPLPPPFDQIPTLPGVDANGVYVAHVTLGSVGAAAGTGSDDVSLGSVGVPPSTVPPAAPPGTTGPPPGGNDFVQALTPPGAAPPPVVAPGSAPLLRGFVDLISKHALETLYAVLAIGTAVLFLGWRAAMLGGWRLTSGRSGR